MDRALEGLRVLDLSEGVAGGIVRSCLGALALR